jgi:hypothetical protein
MVGLLAKKGKGYYLFPSIDKAAANPEQLFQLTTRSVSGNLLRRNHSQSVVPRRIHVSPLILFGQAKAR